MKIIKRFNDGTALVQRGECQPEIIKIEDIKEEDRACKVTIVSLDDDGFVIEGTDLHVTISSKSKLHIKVDTPDEQYQGTVLGDKLLEFMQNLIKILETPTIARPSK
jgi:hypothetical protein